MFHFFNSVITTFVPYNLIPTVSATEINNSLGYITTSQLEQLTDSFQKLVLTAMTQEIFHQELTEPTVSTF